MAGLLGGLSFPVWLTGEPVSAHKLEQMRQAALRLDAVQYMPLSVFCTAVSHWPWRYQRNPVLIWRGAVTWRSSATQLTVVVDWTGSVLAGDRVRISVGSSTADYTVAAGLNVYTISASYPDLTVVPITITLVSTSRGAGGYPNPSPEWPDVFVREVSIAPIAPTWPYPSVTSFGDVTQPRLQSLTNQLLWLWQAYGMHVRPVNPYPHREQGNLTGRIDRGRWVGSCIRPATHTHLRVRGHVQVTQGGQAETIEVRVNSALVGSWSIPTDIGVHHYEIVSDITSVAVNTRAYIDIRHVKAAPAGTVSPNYVTISDVAMINPAPTPLSLPDWTPRLSVSYGDLKSRLQQLRTAVETIYNRYTSTTEYWQRQLAGAARTGKDEFIFEYVEPAQPHTAYRAGEALIVFGEQARLVRGAITYQPRQGNDPIQWGGSVETSLLSSQSTQSAIIYLDNVTATPVGSLYYVRGTRLYYVAEWLGGI